jgi:hypothetical protein
MKQQMLRVVYIFIWFGIIMGAVNAYAEESPNLGALLIDLDDWRAEDAENSNLDMNGMSVFMATREYTKGDALRIEVSVFIGNNVVTQGKVSEITGGDLKSETTESKLHLSKIDGFQVYTTYAQENHTSDIIVFLAQTETEGALFTFTSKGLPEKDALGLAKKFNWQNMKTAVEKLFPLKKHQALP